MPTTRKGMNILNLFLKRCMGGTFSTDRHLFTLFAIALACKGKTYIELGVKSGNTTRPILAAAYLNDGYLTSVDIEATSLEVSNALASHWQFVKSDSITFLERWDDSQMMDFVFVDDRHSYGHVKRELELIGDHVGPSSVILLHDLMYEAHEPFYHSDANLPEDDLYGAGGPYRAVAELDTSIWEWATLPWGHGLTLLRRK